ncbi:MAG: DinB family protein [Chloroflexi bacterium]|nr:DinB family protein [Chloroflexota bacterium]
MPEHPSERPQLLVDYLESTFAIEQVLGELSEDQLESREGPDEWSVRQIVHHLTDNEVADAMRLRQMLAHDSPLIVPFDEQLFHARLHYDREIESSVATFFALRASSGAILEQIAAEDWSREGRHEERERYSVEILVQQNIVHDRAHLDQIRRALTTTGDG